MSTENNLCCKLTFGKVYVRPYFCPTTAQPNRLEQWRDMGNILEFNITSDINEIEQKNFTSRAGGVDCYYAEIEALNLEMTVGCTQKENLALALLAGIKEEATATITDEEHYVTGSEALILLKKPADMSTVVVTDDAGTTTYVLDTDYSIVGREIRVLSGGNIADENLKISYTAYTLSMIDIFEGSSVELEIKFQGSNKADANSIFDGHLYRVRLTPAESFSFIDDGVFKTLELSGKLLEDSQVTTGSKYGTLIESAS